MELFSGHFQAKRIKSENIRIIMASACFWCKSAASEVWGKSGKIISRCFVWKRHCLLYVYLLLLFFTFLPVFVSFFLLNIFQASFQSENFPWRSSNITFKEVSYGWVVERNIHYNSFPVLYSPVLYFWIIWMHIWFKRSIWLAQVRKYFDTCGTNQNFALCQHLP